jgi:hypothetical protein
MCIEASFPRLDRATTATYVAALMEAGFKSASAAIAEGLRLAPGMHRLAGGLVDNTPFDLTAIAGISEPAHGYYEVAQAERVTNAVDAASLGAAPGQTAQANHTIWMLASRGSGVEALAVYEVEGQDVFIACYAGHPVIGRPFAGVALGSMEWLKHQVIGRHDRKGEALIGRIRHSEKQPANYVCAYSLQGRPARIGFRSFEADVTAGEEVCFALGWRGEWANHVSAERLPWIRA